MAQMVLAERVVKPAQAAQAETVWLYLALQLISPSLPLLEQLATVSLMNLVA